MDAHHDDDLGFPEPPDGFLTYPTNQVAAHLDEPDEVCAALEDLVEAGFDRSKVFALVGPEGAERLDVSGRHHGLQGRIYRLVEHLGDARDELLRAAEHLRGGGLVLTVPADTDQEAASAARILKAHGSRRTNYFAKGTWVELGP